MSRSANFILFRSHLRYAREARVSTSVPAVTVLGFRPSSFHFIFCKLSVCKVRYTFLGVIVTDKILKKDGVKKTFKCRVSGVKIKEMH